MLACQLAGSAWLQLLPVAAKTMAINLATVVTQPYRCSVSKPRSFESLKANESPQGLGLAGAGAHWPFLLFPFRIPGQLLAQTWMKMWVATLFFQQSTR